MGKIFKRSALRGAQTCQNRCGFDTEIEECARLECVQPLNLCDCRGLVSIGKVSHLAGNQAL